MYDDAKVRERIMTFSAQGMDNQSIAESLMKEGFTTPTGKKISNKWVSHKRFEIKSGRTRRGKSLKTPSMLTIPIPETASRKQGKVLFVITDEDSAQNMIEKWINNGAG